MTEMSTFLAQVDFLISADDDELSQEARRQLVKSAVERYSLDRPEQVTTDVSGDGGKYYAISNLTSFVDGFSHVISIEYPAQSVGDDEQPQYLDSDDWDDDYWSGGTRYLLLPNHSPAATETIRVRYTAPYTWTNEDVSTPAQDFYAICHLAAGLCCQAIAAKYARTSDSTIAADSVDHAGRSERFRRMSRSFIGYYNEHMGLLKSDESHITTAAGTIVDLDTAPRRGRRWLFHNEVG